MCFISATSCVILALILHLTTLDFVQQRPLAEKKQEAAQRQNNFVEVPVLVRDRENECITELKKEDFTVYEDGVQQSLSLFARAEEPFHIALLLDTYGSSQEELPRLQQATLAFIQQLQPQDQVMIVSFADEVKVETEFTSDRNVLAQAISRLQPGQSTHLFDAVALTIKRHMSQAKGRKAMILFSDGVDMASEQMDEAGTLRELEESNVMVHSIRYDTRAAVQRGLRKPKMTSTAPPTPIPAPESEPSRRDPDPSPRQWPQPWPFPFPNPNPSPWPDDPSTTPYPDRVPMPQPDRPPRPHPIPVPERESQPTRMPRPPAPDPNDPLVIEYQRGERFLWDLSDRAGGGYFEVDLLDDLPTVLERIAEELRYQYTLGYAPRQIDHEGRYRRIRVRVNRPGVRVRARPGYRLPE